ncbi:restriction endonuclease subunit S [Faecalibacterium longum]|jgi:type I restriction enzyme S subunit|uniref:Restriction endonuclease subunit S n=1 Tax=Faecalibacterium longum TaxID=1851428 RepID=A0ABV1ITA5_9FIRM|nr:restriction endonuclease subunit S [Faecalibacterium longum]MCC2183146.1 restriction endonuclease subunit S [Faecalibacterium longum CLA-AA-H236]
MAKLGDYVKIRTGKLDANASSESGQYPFFTCAIEPLKIDSYSYDCECVLVAGNGDLNVKYYSGKFDAYQRTYIIESMDKTFLDVQYLYFFMDKYLETLRSQSIGGVIKYIKLGNLTEADIFIPSIERQRKIVQILRKSRKLISLRKQQLAKLDELVKARFVEMFGDPVSNPKHWKTAFLLDIGYCKNGMNFHKGDSGVDIHCLGVGDFKNRTMIQNVEDLPFVSLNELPDPEYLLRDNDIIFVRSNGNKELVGRCLAIYPGSIPVTYSGFCIRYRLTSTNIDTPYLLQVLKTDSIRKKMTGRGANIQNLNQQTLSQLLVPIPPLSLQNEFAAFVERVDQQKQTIQQSLEKLELMKKVLMQEYFG